jgi:hypothetical protein
MLRTGTLSKHSETSKTYLARKGSYSQKTTVPDWVVNLLDIKPGDEITWQVIFNEEEETPNAVLVYKKEDS